MYDCTYTHPIPTRCPVIFRVCTIVRTRVRLFTVKLRSDSDYEVICDALSTNETMHIYPSGDGERFLFGLRAAAYELGFPDRMASDAEVARAVNKKVQEYSNRSYESVRRNVALCRFLMLLSQNQHFARSSLFQVASVLSMFHSDHSGVILLRVACIAF